MKTLVMFEAFGGRLKSEPEIFNLQHGQDVIKFPFMPPIRIIEKAANFSQMVATKAVTFTYAETVKLPDWELPIRKFVLTEI